MTKPKDESTWLDQVDITLLKKGDIEALRLAWHLNYVSVTKRAIVGECTHPKTISCGILFSVIVHILTNSLLKSLMTFFTIGSIPGLMYLIVAGRSQYYSLADIRKEDYEYWMENKEKITKFWVARFRGELAGTVAVEIGKDKIANVIRVAVVPKFGRKGLGSKLMAVCHQFCSDLRCHKIKLGTTAYQSVAIRMYQKLGYKQSNTWKVGLALEVVPFEYELQYK